MESSLKYALSLFSLILFYYFKNSTIPLIWWRAAGCKTQTIFIGNESAVNAGCLGEWECQLPWVSPSLDCCRCRRGGGCTSVCCHVVTTRARSHTPTEEQREERSEERTSASPSLHNWHAQTFYCSGFRLITISWSCTNGKGEFLRAISTFWCV